MLRFLSNMENTGMDNGQSLFWNDLARDLEDPSFLRHYIVESLRIATVDGLVNALDEAREEAGLTKADIARAVRVEPAVVRRFFASGAANPTLATVAEVAAALGMRVTVERMPATERRTITEPLLKGKSRDTSALAEQLTSMRRKTKARTPQ
jgi:transcriptional regulator with XRE-family HTH domain